MSRPYDSARSLVVIDLENLAKTSRPDVLGASSIVDRLQQTLPISVRDHVVVAANPGNAFAAEIVRKRLQGSLRLRHGRNGADLALIEAVEVFLQQDLKRSSRSVCQLVLCSGDGIFAGVALWARQSAGLKVVGVAERSQLSRRLASVCNEIRHFPNHSHLAVAG